MTTTKKKLYPKIYDELDKLERKEFGRKLLKKRMELDITRKTAAKMMDISVEMVVRIENGYISPETPGLLHKVENLRKKEYMRIVI